MGQVLPEPPLLGSLSIQGEVLKIIKTFDFGKKIVCNNWHLSKEIPNSGDF